MTNRHVAFGLVFLGLLTWFAPGFNGVMFEQGSVSDGEAQIASAVYIVGAAIVWFQRP